MQGHVRAVESRRGALVEGGVSSCRRRLSPQCRCLSLHLDRVSSLRSSNRACGFPALGSRSRSCLRSREAALQHAQAYQAVVRPQPLVREAHVFPGPHLVLPTQPLTQPLRRVGVDRAVGRTRLPQAEVVLPAEQDSVQVSHHSGAGNSPFRAFVSALILRHTLRTLPRLGRVPM